MQMWSVWLWRTGIACCPHWSGTERGREKGESPGVIVISQFIKVCVFARLVQVCVLLNLRECAAARVCVCETGGGVFTVRREVQCSWTAAKWNNDSSSGDR